MKKILLKAAHMMKLSLLSLFSSSARIEFFHRLFRWQLKRRRFAKKKRYTFINRQKGSENLVLILAGFQPYYWEVGFNNIKISVSKINADVCICVPEGTADIQPLYEIAEKNGWSLLHLKDDLLAQVQNTAILLHKNAKKIYKLDEDIMIAEDFFLDMEKAYNLSLDYEYDPGLIVPVLNINMATMHEFLNALKLRDEFDSKFGKRKRGDTFFWTSPEVAEFLQMPFVASSISDIYKRIKNANNGILMPIPCRYSIGAILIKRDFWEEIGCFEVHELGAMGKEEEQVISWCHIRNKPIILAAFVSAAHLGYFPTKETCRRIFEEHPEAFSATSKD